MKTEYNKSARRMFGKQIVRMLSIVAIFLVTISLVSGLGDVSGNIFRGIHASYDEDNVHDILIRSSSIDASENSEVENALNNLKAQLGIEQIEKYYTYDIKQEDDDKHSRRYAFIDKNKNEIDRLQILEGRLPEKADEVAIDAVTKDYHHRYVGEEITLPEVYLGKVTVVGIVRNPTSINLTDEPSDYYTEEKPNYANDIFYFDINSYPPYITMMLPMSLRITLTNREDYPFLDTHKTLVNETKSNIEFAIKTIAKDKPNVDPSHFTVLTIFDNYSLFLLNEMSHKVETIAFFFIVFFIFIAVLVVYSTMSRLLDEDRASIATLKTLGYSNFMIALRYIAYVFVAGLLGGLVSLIPAFYVNRIILDAFGIGYLLKEISIPIAGPYFYILSSITLVLSILLTAIKSMKVAKQKPIDLLTHKAPKIGKKILLERIKIIWNHLSFKYKSTIRNIFLFKSRLLMTLLSVIASTMLIFASFALLDKSYALEGFESLRVVSMVLLIFSGALCALIVYNITNINVSERTREIATLMVLGYRTNESTGYIYREIYIMSIVGALLGLPLGIAFVKFVFNYVNLGDIDVVKWYSYVCTPIITIIFAFLATLLLRRKIVNTDMNESLKTLE